MADYSQAKRPISITTPLGKDVLLLAAFKGQEALSQIFRFQAELLAKLETKVSFDAILGQGVTVELLNNMDGSRRHFHGIVQRFTQGRRDQTFTHFRAEIVPRAWLLSKKVQSRIFQHLPVPDILKKVLVGFDVKWEITGSYYPRDYCVQYRESDFAFASRLMEEEGIFYFFKHSDGNHTMVVADDPTQHPDVSGQTSVPYDELVGGGRDETRVSGWEKTQELRSAKYALWDHCFELPGKNLEAKDHILASVPVGTVTHKLEVGANAPLEIYEYPGDYARRFDGVDPGGGDRPPDLQQIFKDNLHTARIRMQQEAMPSLEIKGDSNAGHFSAGHKFTLARHFDADGAYLLTRVEHLARMDHYRSDQAPAFSYVNRFSAIPAALPYRPARTTARPVIAGTQTATVVGPPGEELFVDKYGRVKVQFHWDREGKKDPASSCWLRVAQVWAGKGWGAFFWPRIGHEVVVAFEEGDPDQPIVVGSVYNAENMPPYALPLKKQLGGIRSASVSGKASQNFNGVVFNDEKSHEHLSIHSERNMSLNSEYDKMIHAGRHKGERVSSSNVFTVGALPTGGGSGGGFDAGNTMPSPPPIGILGLNSSFVFGENLQVATGLNHQLAVGNNLQICINPVGLAAGQPGLPGASVLTAILGSGLGGNMQVTVGTNASIVMGQSIDISYGPSKIELHGGYHDHIPTSILLGVLSLAAILWVILYAAIHEDKDRAAMAIVFQILVDGLLLAILAVEMGVKKGEENLDDGLKRLFRIGEQNQRLDDGPWEMVSFAVMDAALALISLPIVAVSSESNDTTGPAL